MENRKKANGGGEGPPLKFSKTEMKQKKGASYQRTPSEMNYGGRSNHKPLGEAYRSGDFWFYGK